MCVKRYKVSPGDDFFEVEEDLGEAFGFHFQMSFDLGRLIEGDEGPRVATTLEIIEALIKIEAYILEQLWPPECPNVNGYLLQEDGFKILQEDGSGILVEG